MADTTTNLAAAALTFSVLSFLLLIVAVLFTIFPDFSKTIRSGIGVGTVSGAGIFGNLKMVGALLGAFSPDITLLSGFVSDIMNGSFRYSVTSFIGIITVILHWVIAGLLYGYGKGSTSSPVPTVPTAPVETALNVVSEILGTGAAATAAVPKPIAKPPPIPGSVFTATGSTGLPPPARPTRKAATAASGLISRVIAQNRRNTTSESASQSGSGQDGGAINLSQFNPCSIRGLGMFDISKSPMGMAALTSVFTVYLLDMYVGNKRSKIDTGVYLLFSSVVYGLNVFAYKEFGCYGSTYGEVAKATILPIVVGLAGGAAGYSVLQTTFPSYLPLDGQAIGSPASPGTIVPGTARCNAPNDQDQFVCDAYKDGKRISTSTVA